MAIGEISIYIVMIKRKKKFKDYTSMQTLNEVNLVYLKNETDII